MPSHLRVRLRGSRISATHLPQLRCLTPRYLNLLLSGPPLPLHLRVVAGGGVVAVGVAAGEEEGEGGGEGEWSSIGVRFN